MEKSKKYYPKKQDWSIYKSVFTQLDYEAKKRDSFKCIECNKTTGLEVHHIEPKIEKLENLITLCHSCHKKKHNMAGCFKKGYDSRRGKPVPTPKNFFKKGVYYNRWLGKWIGK